jgi:thiamine-phosphate diphosphorylase
LFDLYLITPELAPDRIEHAVTRALEGAPRGRIALQLRAKHLHASARRALGERLRVLTHSAGAALLVNAELALCTALDADGVQLPEHGPSVAVARDTLGPNALIGASRHDFVGVAHACAQGASFATLSPICASPGKGEPIGFDALERVARAVALPVFALGGLGLAEIPRALGAGAHGIAVIRSVLAHDDPAHAVAELLAGLDRARTLGG